MKFYRLHNRAPDGGLDLDYPDEWFLSLQDAKTRRDEWIAANPYGEGLSSSEWSIDQVIIKGPVSRTLLLAILNGKGFIDSRREVVPEYVFPQRPEGD